MKAHANLCRCMDAVVELAAVGVDIDGQLKLKNSRVLIIGLGGLGSPVALYLAAAGVGELHLADFDRVDLTNLQRQIIHDTASVGESKVDSALRRLNAINPEIKLVAHRSALDADSLADAVAAVDLVLDCCDNFSTREAVNAACVAARKPLVSGAAIRLEGQLSVFDSRQPTSPCYHCLYGHGSEEELTCSEAGVIGPLIGLVGSLQALEELNPTVDLHAATDVFQQGDGANIFNVSTASALVISAAGCTVAKHANRAVSGSCGVRGSCTLMLARMAVRPL